MSIYVPTKLVEITSIIIESTIDFINLKEEQKSKLNKSLISIWYYIYNKQIEDPTIDNLNLFTNIHNTYLDKFGLKINGKKFGYASLLLLLKKHNLVDINYKHSGGLFSQGYRVITNFINTDYSEVEIDFEKVFDRFKNRTYWLRKYPQYKKLIKDTYEVKIDLSDYILWMKENEGIELKPVINKGILKRRFLTKEKIYEFINNALKVNFNNLWFKVSDEGRFYNSTTNLSYTTLPFIKLKRRKVVEVDVINCQPLLLCGIIKNELYKKDVEDGIFYDRVSKELNISRDQFKVLSYKHIFFSNKPLKSGKIYDVINRLYPGFIDEMNSIKIDLEVSKEMQKIESNIFVKNIGSLDFKMMLRHDAVFVYEEDLEIIKAYVISEFKNIGLNCKLK